MTDCHCPGCGQRIECPYLGVIFDWRKREIVRGAAKPVRTAHSLLVVLYTLAAAKGADVSEEALLLAYRANSAAACDRLIQKKVSSLRIMIRPLGLAIDRARRGSYRLIEGGA